MAVEIAAAVGVAREPSVCRLRCESDLYGGCCTDRRWCWWSIRSLDVVQFWFSYLMAMIQTRWSLRLVTASAKRVLAIWLGPRIEFR